MTLGELEDDLDCVAMDESGHLSLQWCNDTFYFFCVIEQVQMSGSHMMVFKKDMLLIGQSLEFWWSPPPGQLL